MTQEFHAQAYTQETEKRVHTNTHTHIFTAALLAIAKTWERPARRPTDEWISQM